MKYVIISPVRNEGDHISQTLDSMLKQTILPQEWIIVDDGSSDETLKIIEEAAKHQSWIKVICRADRGARKSGTGVMETFYDGYDQITFHNWEVLVKLDGDLAFEANYFEEAFKLLSKNDSLGIVGGDICHYKNDNLVPERPDMPSFHVRGASKIYRRECWDAIEGLIHQTGWDTMDEVKANMLGWKTCRIPELKLVHLKPTGVVDGTYKNGFKNGRASFICGYHPLYLVGRCIKRLFDTAPIVESSGLFAGYFSGYFAGIKRVEEKQAIKYMRREQLKRLFGMRSLWDVSKPQR